MIKGSILAIVLSFIVNYIIISLFEIKELKEQLAMQVIVLSILGGLIYIIINKQDSDIDEIIEKIIIYALVFIILFILFRLVLHIYTIGLHNIQSYTIIGFIILSVIIIYNVYLINRFVNI